MQAQPQFKNFELTAHRKDLARFCVRYELYKEILPVKGSIIECGVHNGGGILAWAKLSATLEPYALHRKVIGFDTFEGFPAVHDKDDSAGNSTCAPGEFKPDTDSLANIQNAIQQFDENRYLSEFNKVELIKGDACQTIPIFLEENPHLVVSLLFLDFDLYEPTKVALDTLMSRIPKGGVVAFDEINNEGWPGETQAMVEYFGSLNKIEIKKYPFETNIAYIVV